MPSTKRKAVGTDERRKSARLSKMRSTSIPNLSFPAHCIDLWSLGLSMREDYTAFVPFARHSRSLSELGSATAKVQEALHAVEETATKMQRELNSKWQGLQDAVYAFQSKVISHSKTWYEGGDLTSLDDENFEWALSSLHLRNAKGYYTYLCTALPRAAKSKTPYAEAHSKDVAATFDEKILRLISRLYPLYDGARYALHAYVMVLTEVFPAPQDSRKVRDGGHIYKEIFTELQMLADRRDPTDVDRKRFWPRRLKRTPAKAADLNDPTLSTASMYDTPLVWNYPTFSDFATAARTLGIAWKKPCPAIGNTYRPREKCWHQSNARTLDLLQKRAYGEVRWKVFLTIGTKLPAELAESVFEMVLIAEGLPSDPAVCDRAREDSSDSDQEERERPSRGHNHFHERRVKASYLCAERRDDPPWWSY